MRLSHFLHNYILPINPPIQANKTPTTMEVVTYRRAFFVSFCCNNWIVSYPKVEKVVNAPRNPVPTNNHAHSGILFSIWNMARRPRKNEPKILMNHVPIGNVLEVFFVIHEPRKNREMAPNIPPIPTNTIILLLHSFGKLLLHLLGLGQFLRVR